MDRNILIKIFKLIYKRTIVFYLVVLIGLYFVINFNHTQKKYELVSLSRLRPSSDYIIKLNLTEPSEVNQKKMREYLRYFQKVDKIVPGRVDTLGMIGYCKYYLGDVRGAKNYLEKAVSQHPIFFWYRYNLGVLYYQDKEYQKATEQFLAAMSSSAELSIKYIFDSIIYRALISESNVNDPKEFAVRIKEKRQFLSFLLASSYLHAQEYQKALFFSLQSLSSHTPNDAVALYYAGKASFHLGQNKEAVVYLKQSIEVNPNFIEAYDVLIEIFKNMGQESLASQVSAIRNQFKKSGESPLVDLENPSLKIF